MLSKEEIEEYQKTLYDLINDEDVYESIKQAVEGTFKYIEQLETKNQKLIEKLEEDKRKNNKFDFYPLQAEVAYNNYYKLGKIDEIDEILKKLKGEKQWGKQMGCLKN